jgi:hypothetical protein
VSFKGDIFRYSSDIDAIASDFNFAPIAGM